MRAAVIGHVEWVEFVRVPALPAPGTIVHAEKWWEEPAGGGPVAAVQLARLGAETTFFTALGDDDLGHRAHAELRDRGLDVQAVFRDEPTRRAITFVDATGERTITVLGQRLAPHLDDELPWDRLKGADSVYFTAGDASSLREARAAGTVVATARVLDVVKEAAVQLDALVGSSVDPGERFSCEDVDPVPRLCVWTEGDAGGRFVTSEGESGRYEATQLGGPVVDRYGAGDAFVACLTFALGRGDEYSDALSFAARCGAAVLGGRGPYEAQLKLQ